MVDISIEMVDIPMDGRITAPSFFGWIVRHCFAGKSGRDRGM